MTLSARERRLLVIWPVAVIIVVVWAYWPEDSAPAPAAAATQPATPSIDQAEKRLARLREIAAGVPAKEAALKLVSAELATREKGLIQADTAPQAQAQILQMVRRLAAAEAPPIEIRSTEIGAIATFGEAYGSVNVSVQMECRIEQLINLLAALGAQPELVAPGDLRITSSSPKEKMIGARLTLTALVPRKLLPEKKGAAL